MVGGSAVDVVVEATVETSSVVVIGVVVETILVAAVVVFVVVGKSSLEHNFLTY